MKVVYGCQRIGRSAETGRLEHKPPLVVAEGEHVDCYSAIDIFGPSLMLTNREKKPAEVDACTDHVHSIWLQTDALVNPMPESIEPDPKASRVWVCGTVAKAKLGEYKAGAIVIADEHGQRSAYSISIDGPSRMFFRESEPVIGFCPCRQNHPHRIWLETLSEIRVLS